MELVIIIAGAMVLVTVISTLTRYEREARVLYESKETTVQVKYVPEVDGIKKPSVKAKAIAKRMSKKS